MSCASCWALEVQFGPRWCLISELAVPVSLASPLFPSAVLKRADFAGARFDSSLSFHSVSVGVTKVITDCSEALSGGPPVLGHWSS